jgi:hypothetical protein
MYTRGLWQGDDRDRFSPARHIMTHPDRTPGVTARLLLCSNRDVRWMLRQTPGGDGAWGPLRVTCDPADPHDWLLMVDCPPEGFVTRVPPERRIAMVEPRDVRDYPRAFLDQFGAVIGPEPPRGFAGAMIAGQPCMPWFYGLRIAPGGPVEAARDWAALARGPALPVEARPGLLSAVCSTKTITSNQLRRLRFVRRLKARLGDRFTLFGRGFAALDDKAEGVDGFRYHLVLENNLIPGFWTEKLADAILGGAFPIVAGGGGLARWFDPAGFLEIDLRAPRAAEAALLALLDHDPIADPAIRGAMTENRRRLMEEHQLFPALARFTADPARAAAPTLAAPVPLAPPRRGPAERLARAARPLRLAGARLAMALTERG